MPVHPLVRLGAVRVRIPILRLVGAFRDALDRAREVASDDREPSSPGGARVTAGEVAEAWTAFVTTFAAEALAVILEANGLLSG